MGSLSGGVAVVAGGKVVGLRFWDCGVRYYIFSLIMFFCSNGFMWMFDASVRVVDD